ncbi:MAG: acyl-CoA dehydrogenase family protein [Alphaproteobacteria bacterium]|nr:acyl-CoA dehydrogenase family protein [Alphaproteobacteria bacterium]MBU2082587.1 acyl-CoA dehydrogenase family protein [Alphaproteobacteria bacterium]MBU2142773.1 acyl-CoA dehydrogenase family protein [Alphaproteobacteria bacterium]MBU2195195.1 acyl-CoA dehydrogenase family protein [Alphaproteobacteria bacterium]
MNLDLTTEDSEFRSEVRAFLCDNLTEELSNAGRLVTSVFIEPQFSLPWQKILYAQGWAAPAWPVEYGGTGWTEMQRYIFASECARAGAPSLSPMGLAMVGPCIIGHGTPEQKAHYLPRILAGQDYWCQGYSEPGSGSDLASLSLKAESDGDDYVLNGTKIWTTHAHHANMMFCLVRTRFDGKPQEGITFLLLDMTLPGIKVDPIITLAGEHEVNQVFFDDVRVPKSGRLGAENDGWTVAKYLLEFERGGGSSAGLEASVGRIRALAARDGLLASDPAFTSRLAAAEIGLEAIKITEQRVSSALSSGGNPGPAASMLKVQRTEMMQRIDTLGVEAGGAYACVEQLDARQPGSNIEPVGPSDRVTLVPRYLNNRAASIYGGSNEVQRNIMAKMVLGL